MAFTTGGPTNDALAPRTIMAVMATPRRATNQSPIVLCTASWPTIMVAALVTMPNTRKYATGEDTRNISASMASSMTAAPSAMLNRAPFFAMSAPTSGAESPCTSTNSEKPVPSMVAFIPSDASWSMSGLTMVAVGKTMPEEQKYMNPSTGIKI